MVINFHSKDLLDLFRYLILNGLTLVMMLSIWKYLCIAPWFPQCKIFCVLWIQQNQGLSISICIWAVPEWFKRTFV